MNVEIHFESVHPLRPPPSPQPPSLTHTHTHTHNKWMVTFCSYMDDGTFLHRKTYRELGKMLSTLIGREDGKEMFWAVAAEADRRHPRGAWPLREGIPNSCFTALVSLFEGKRMTDAGRLLVWLNTSLPEVIHKKIVATSLSR